MKFPRNIFSDCFRKTGPDSASEAPRAPEVLQAPTLNAMHGAARIHLNRALNGGHGTVGIIASFLDNPQKLRFCGNSDEPGLVAQRNEVLDALEATAQVMNNNNLNHVTTRSQFMETLGPVGTQVAEEPHSIRSLHPTQRANPLFILGLKINRFLPENKPATTAAFVAAVKEIPLENRTDGLIKLANVAEISMKETVNFNPMEVAKHGGNIQQTASFYGISNNELRHIFLQQAAATSDKPGSAGAAARGGGNATQIAADFGISASISKATLQQLVGNSESVKAAATGGATDQLLRDNYGLDNTGIRQVAEDHNPYLHKDMA